MNIAKARIKHHTITSTASFTAPVNLNFTGNNWTETDLYESEFGINVANTAVFIRIGGEIYEIITDGSNRFSEYIDVFSGLVGNTASGVEQVLYSKTIPADYFEDQTGFNIRAGLRTGSNADPKEFAIKFGGQVIYTSTTDSLNPSDGRHLIDFDFIRNGTASVSIANVMGSSQITYGTGTASLYDVNVGVGFTGTYSWDAPIDIQITASASNVDDIELFSLKIYDIR
jgi:hypothetical protein